MLVVILISGILGSTVLAGAQSASTTRGVASPEPASPVAATPVGTPGRAVATPVAGGAPAGSFASYDFDDVTVRGMHGSTSFTFPLPLATTGVGGGSLELVYSHSPLLVPDLSTMTVIVNGRSIDSVHLTKETASGASLAVELPPLPEDTSAVNLTLAFHLRLTRDNCEVPDDPALWATIHKESSITLQEGDSAAAPHLVDLPAMLERSATETGNGPVFVLPERPNVEEMNAAGVVAYQLGRWSGRTGDSPAVGDVLSEPPASDQAAILVGQADALDIGTGWGDLEWDGEQFLLDGAIVPAEYGILAIRQQPVPQLLVSGVSPEAVQLAARALEHPLDPGFFDAPAVVVTSELPDVSSGRYAWQNDAASFLQLGVPRRDLTGPGEHFVDLSFERPAGWVIQSGSVLRLDLDTSPAIREETSWVRIIVNGIDIGSEPIRVSDSGVERYEFELPVERLNNDLEGRPVRTLTIQVRIFLDYPHEECESIDPQGTWAALLPTSAWMLPHGEAEGLDLGRFPMGLVNIDDPTGMTVVLPGHPTSAESQAALHAIAAVGRWNAWTEPATPEIRSPERIAAEDLQDRSVIIIGGPDRNSLATELDAGMLDAIQPAVRRDLEAPYGVLALGTSPWSDGETVLAIAGPGEEGQGTLLAATALGDEAVLLEMQGTRIAITGDGGPQRVTGPEPANPIPSDLAPQVLPDERPWIERIPAWQVIGGIVLATFVALVIGIVMLRWIRGGTR